MEQRRQNIQLVEHVASLEADLANEKSRRESTEKRLNEEVNRLKTERSDEIEQVKIEKIKLEKRLKSENEQLEDVVGRQRSVISELKGQCNEVTGKFEESFSAWMREKKARIYIEELKFGHSYCNVI